MQETLYELLAARKDIAALEILKEQPELCDNTVVRLALDNRCFKTIAYLRELDLITLAGREEREAVRLQLLNDNLAALENITKDIEQYLATIRRD